MLLEACNGPAALCLAANHRGSIDLLFIDIVMPHMDGFTLGERLVESHPETLVLFMSGHSDRSVAVRGGLKEAGQPFLLKPFTCDDLLRTIRDQLDTEAGRKSDSDRRHEEDRRSEVDRRKGGRRERDTPVPTDRRVGHDRRIEDDRRTGVDRRTIRL